MRHLVARYLSIVIVAISTTLLANCTDHRPQSADSDTSRAPQASDTLYNEQHAMAVYANNLQRALLIIDSARTVGNLTRERADLLRATVYSRTFDAPRYDSAIVIAERLLNSETAKRDTVYRENVLEVLVSASRQLADYEMQLHYSTRLANTYRQHGNHVEALRTDAEVGAVLYRLGKTDEGLGKMDSVIRILTPVRRFNELDACIIAMKRKIGVVRAYPVIASQAQQMLDRLKDYEQHAADFHDGSAREPADEDRAGYIAFYRAQAWTYLAAAYAHMNAPQKAREYLTLAEQSDFGRTLSGKKMMAPTLCMLGEYDKMEAIYHELATTTRQHGDTLTLDYAQLLLDRAKAASQQGRLAESNTLWEQHAHVLQEAEERLLRSKANLYAARYHAQEQQLAINRQQTELTRRSIINIALTIGILLLLAIVVYVLRQQRMLRQKNNVLAREITDAISYRQKLETIMMPRQPVGETDAEPASLADLTDEQLFQHIRKVVERDEMFLDPTLNRQKLTTYFSLPKERIGAAFSKGSTYNSVTDFINDCRLPYAARLLAERPDLSIAEVAKASGFARAATFTTNFKKKFALTPAQFREQVNK